jgi:hypothetical protein
MGRMADQHQMDRTMDNHIPGSPPGGASRQEQLLFVFFDAT